MALLLTGSDLAQCLPMEDAVASVEAALTERAEQTLVSPPRTFWPVGPSGITITPGGLLKQGVVGFRVYLRGDRGDQLTAIWNVRDGALKGIILGPELGATRTGAIGGVAVKWMAPRETPRIGVIGGGFQSRMQLLAVRAVRPKVAEVRVYRRDPARREEVAREWREETGLDVRPAESAEEAVKGAQIVILATTASEPAIQANWLLPECHVNSMGPAYRGRSEIGMDLLESADTIATDTPELYRAEPDFILAGTPLMPKLKDLAEVVAAAPVRSDKGRTVFLSHGLSGTEVAVARQALSKAALLGIGTEISATG